MAENIVQKIISAHLTSGEMHRGQPISVRVDQLLTQDLTGILVSQYIDAVSPEELSVGRMCFYCDHKVICASSEDSDDHLYLRGIAQKYGGYYSKPGNGICHFLSCQRFAAPGQILIGSDSHTPTSGALGMLAIGSGGLTVAEIALGMDFRMNMPGVMKIELTGKLQKGVSAKDIALEIMRRIRTDGGRGCILEFAGDGLEDLSVSERQTIANMSIETGAFTGIFPADDKVRRFLRAQQREDDYTELCADEGAAYDEEIRIDLSELEPLVARPSMPDNVARVMDTELTPCSVFIGSCTNGSYKDIAEAASILRGHKVSPLVDLTIGPGSRQVLEQLTEDGITADLLRAGARIIECSCGPCIGIGQVPPHGGDVVRTSNRNFPGRAGVQDANTYLVSPMTAAATAVCGRLTDPREFAEQIEVIREPDTAPVDDSGIIAPLPPEERKTIKVIQGPNISDLPERGPVREVIDAVVSLKVGDGITTDDIVPSNPDTIKFNANIPVMSGYTFAYVDGDFARRAQEAGHSIIVGGDNYGQGSSRESAALLPMFLGVEAVLARSFARIHKENLINYGIIPLEFADEDDYDRIQSGSRIVISNVAESIESGEFIIEFPDEGMSVKAKLAASELDRKLLMLGGALNYLKTLSQPDKADS